MTNQGKPRQISSNEEKAIALLLMGKNDREVAEVVGVARQTVWEWRNRNPDFIAALNARRHELWGAQVERLRQLVAQAVDALEKDLQQHRNARLRQAAAVHILRAVGLYGADLRPSGHTTPDAVAAQTANDELFKDILYQLG